MVQSLVEIFAMDEVIEVLGFIKNGRASEPTRIVKEYLAASSHGRQIMIQIVKEILA